MWYLIYRFLIFAPLLTFLESDLELIDPDKVSWRVGIEKRLFTVLNTQESSFLSVQYSKTKITLSPGLGAFGCFNELSGLVCKWTG